MKLKEGLKTLEKRSVLLLRWFLRAAICMVLLGILVAGAFQKISDARYLLILSVILVSQGVWGAVLFDCLSRRQKNRE